MLRRRLHSTTSLLAAAAYLMALVASSVSHVHVHALGDGAADLCAMNPRVAAHGNHSSHDGCAHHEHDGDVDGALAANGYKPAESPSEPVSDEENCNICRFLGRPILLVKPFELAEASAPVVPLPALQEPAVRPIFVVVTHARAPPRAAQTI